MSASDELSERHILESKIQWFYVNIYSALLSRIFDHDVSTGIASTWIPHPRWYLNPIMALNTSQVYSVTSFGPTTPKEFDFTPLFEDVFLSIVPSALLLLAVPFRMFSLYKNPRKVQWSALHDHKLVSD